MAEEIVHHEAIQQYIGQLATLEKEFDTLDVQILRDTYNRHFPLFQKRDAITSQIRGFWPLVFEQASSMLGFDEHITTEDGHLLSSLRSMTLSRPDVDNEPRTICLSFTFEENDFFEDTVLAKTFVFGKGGEMSSRCGRPSLGGAQEWEEGWRGNEETWGVNEEGAI
ncbi:hypothetical protein B9Z19DRAFT_979401 [Tuber borchii]|uniref:Nucleosome assembly protein n=1 Tax=Tuber borchii TaxID=42251 RepID=A0A2T6ZVN0_TUBBO|nr:hypothetical protein B9Z19DRAFT_979401 [Tuber borchii]